MYFMGGLLIARKGHDYLFVVVDRIRNMCILVPCQNTIKGEVALNVFFEKACVHIGISRSII
jgi:hypothetical protein